MRLYTCPIGDAEPAQLQVLAFPYRENGKVQSIMACTTDTSKLKWAQNFQARLAAEARETKRQQEAFIDVVPHEMRNPLSAIVHCADGISTCLDEVRTKLAEIPEPCLKAFEDNITSANVIMQCAHHQKRIIESMLLSITPSAVRPVKLISSIVSIFADEFKSNNTQCSVTPDPSLPDLNIEYLYLDPSRVTQIFTTLVTNAIKFTKNSKTPSISIKFGATLSDPRHAFRNKMF
jgi:signal transduction histidine kinase